MIIVKDSPIWIEILNPCKCSNRQDIGKVGSLKECKQLCENGGEFHTIEYWAGTGFCRTCIDPLHTTPYLSTHDPGYPPSVHKQGTKQKSVVIFEGFLATFLPKQKTSNPESILKPRPKRCKKFDSYGGFLS